jgi:hypothetical protein
MKKLSLEQYLTEERARLDKFAIWWISQQLIDPTVFPKEMLPGDWDEQLHLLK